MVNKQEQTKGDKERDVCVGKRRVSRVSEVKGGDVSEGAVGVGVGLEERE